MKEKSWVFIGIHGLEGLCMERILRWIWRTAVKILDVLMGLFHIHLTEKQRASLLQFARFGFVGLSGTILGYLIYLGVLLLLRNVEGAARFDYLAGNIVSWMLGVLWNFYWNRKYVFSGPGKQVPWPQALLKTYISYAFSGLILSNILSFFWVEVLKIDRIWAPILNLVVTVPINYLMNKFWAFRQKTEPDQP